MIATNFLSLFSNQLTANAVPWLVLTLTGSATQTGLTAAVTILPSVIMSFFGGARVDRMSARKTGSAHKTPRQARDDGGFGAGLLVMRVPR
jgi:MFS family permease